MFNWKSDWEANKPVNIELIDTNTPRYYESIQNLRDQNEQIFQMFMGTIGSLWYSSNQSHRIFLILDAKSINFDQQILISLLELGRGIFDFKYTHVNYLKHEDAMNTEDLMYASLWLKPLKERRPVFLDPAGTGT